MISEPDYQKIADGVFRRIEDAFRDVDADQVDCERAGDVLTLTFHGGKRCVINTQRPTRQIWVASGARAWHFSLDAQGAWRDDKDASIELYEHLRAVVQATSGVDVSFDG